MSSDNQEKAKMMAAATPFEEALDQTGFGLYNWFHTLVTGAVVVSFACVAYSNTIIVPTSACELGSTSTQQGLMASVPMIGSIIGAVIWGYLGDTRGRRNMLVLSLVLAAVVNALASLAVHWAMLMAFQFTATLIASGMFSLAITLISESVPLARRNLLLLLVTSISLLSQGIMAVLAIPIIPLGFSYYISALDIYWNSWRTVVVVYSLPSLLSLLGLLFIKESPKFLLLQGKEAEAVEALRYMHWFNRQPGEFRVTSLQPEESNKSKTKAKASDQIVPLFRPPLLRYTIIVALLFIFKQVNAFAVWLPRIMDQFVSVLQSGDGRDQTLCGIIRQALDQPPDPNVTPCALNETALLLVLAVAGFQSTVNALISLVLDRTGRRNMTIATTSIIGLCGLLVNAVPSAVASAALFAGFLLGIMTLGLYTAMCVALFPTHLRTMAVSLTLTGGRVATVAAIQVLNYLLENGYCEVGFYVFASIFTCSAIVAAFLPDDRKIVKSESVTKL
ncbi:organic cation/carnitine transporter 7 [Plutella xylostella]|uniref:organic cation/carnitine transporter 7 n=1 Tax=Plutella xylostella TaxID=51655 RepID=UPI00203263B1|nr:organic cation/carnitine transporter 7 [Plutella xylostella]